MFEWDPSPLCKAHKGLQSQWNSGWKYPPTGKAKQKTKESKMKKLTERISLVVQWLRICLPRQPTPVFSDRGAWQVSKELDTTEVLCTHVLQWGGTQVWSLVWEDSTCCRAAKQTHWNYWSTQKPPQWEACALQLESSLCSLQLEKARVQQWRPSTVKNKRK